MYSFIFTLLLIISSYAVTSPAPTSNASPSEKPTPSPTSTLGGVSPVPTTVGTSPSKKPTPSPVSGPISPVPTFDGSVTSLLPTIQGMNVPTPGPTPSPVINGALSRCLATENLLDIIFIVDSSGSIYDDGYKNWENELELVYDIIDNVLPTNSRVGLINFSGCGTSYSFTDCQSQNRLKKMIALSDNGTPNDLDAVLSIVDAIDEDDFNGGYTWTNEALGMALQEFTDNSASDTDKMIILITDGAPYPTNQGHEPCKSSTGYISPTLQSLHQLGVAIVSVAIDVTDDIKKEYFDCISDDDFVFYATFNAYTTAPTSGAIGAPTILPTPSPVSGPASNPVSPAPTAPGASPLPSPGPTPSPVSNGVSPSQKPTPSPTSTLGGVSHEPTTAGVSPTSVGSLTSTAPTSNISPSEKPTPSPTAGLGAVSPAPTNDASPTSVVGTSPVPTTAGSSPLPSPGPTPSPASPTSAGSLTSTAPTSNTSPGTALSLAPTNDASPTSVAGVSPVPTTVGASPSDKPTPSPTSNTAPGTALSQAPTSDASPTSVVGVSPAPTSNVSPSEKPTPSPASSPISPVPTSDASPTSVVGTSLVPTAPGASPLPSPGPTPSPVSGPIAPGTVPTPHQTSVLTLLPTMQGYDVPTTGPTPSPVSNPIMAVEDLSDSIGEFICSELGSSRIIIPTLQPSPAPTSNTVAEPTPSPTNSPTLGNLQGQCKANTELDIIFMVDSSGSVYDDGYINWQSELDLVYEIVNSLPMTTTRASLINFSGCGSSFDLTQCKEQNRLKTEFDLNTYGYNLDMISSRVEEMDEDDFNGGYTWTNEALGLALEQFNSNSNSDKMKIIVLLTDGEPYPYDDGHEPCFTSTGYVSPTLQALNELGVDIITIGIDISNEIKEEKLDCVSSSYYGVSYFNTLETLSVQIGELICDKLDGDFTTMSLAPTANNNQNGEPSPGPTPAPVSSSQTDVPTPNPIISKYNVTEAKGPVTSNGIMANIYINMVIISGFIGFVLF